VRNIFVAAILIGSSSAWMPATAANQEQGASPAPSLASGALGKFVGTWKGEVEVQSADGKKTSYASRNAFTWSLNGRFLRDEGGEISGASAFLGMWTYDPQGKTYRSTYFLGPGGEIVNFTYTWDEKTQVIRGTAPLGGGIIMEAEDRFVGKDSYVWSIVVKDKEGRELNRMTGRQTRVL
jgi:hypothetical protein